VGGVKEKPIGDPSDLEAIVDEVEAGHGPVALVRPGHRPVVLVSAVGGDSTSGRARSASVHGPFRYVSCTDSCTRQSLGAVLQ